MITGISSTSITRRLLIALVPPMVGLAVLLGAGGWWVIGIGVEAVNDRILGASARAIAESLSVDDGQVTLDLPPAAFGMLENSARDSVFYSIRQGSRTITGYTDLPPLDAQPLSDGSAVFADSQFQDRPVRAVAEARRLPGIDELVIVQVAETLDGRKSVARQMLIGLALLEAALVGWALLLIPQAVRWGVRPINLLRDEVNRRRGSDFAPLSLRNVPGELLPVIEAFNALLGRFEGAVRGIRRFTADASHQMRNPLAVLRTHIGVLRQHLPDDPETRSSLDDINHAAERLRHLLLQLLALARAERAYPGDLEFAAVKCGRLLRAIAAEQVPAALESGVDLRIEGDPDSIEIWTDDTLATELLGNLVDNSIRYNREGGRVTIRATSSGDQVVIQIVDTGPGIAPQDRLRVFNRFTRLDELQNPGGSGLGLSIAKVLARRLNAQLDLTEGAGGLGLAVRVVFPAPPIGDI